MMLLEARALCVEFGNRRVLGPLDLDLPEGQVVGLVGPNGAGKSSLLKALAGLVDSGSASHSLLGHSIQRLDDSARARAVGYLPQNPTVAWRLSVRELVGLGRLPHGDGAQDTGRVAVEAALGALGLAIHATRDVRTLSGGEAMRAHLARLAAGEHRVLLVDEPTASLDPGYQLEVLEYLRGLAAAGHSALLVLHDLPLAARYCDRVLVLEAGQIVREGLPATALDDELLARVFKVRGIRARVDGGDVLVGISSLPSHHEHAP
jgi:iron complex transport system ATP-binding protein